MGERTILIVPEPQLREVSAPVAAVDDDIRQLMDDMLATMHRANGIGLAAPQVGLLLRVIVVDVAPPDQPPQPFRMANPEILWTSDTCVVGEEGCLSLPDHFGEVERPERIRVRYLDRDGQMQELEAGGLLAKCIQHEIDHLNGTLFVDHLSALKRNIILRKLAKVKRANEVAAA